VYIILGAKIRETIALSMNDFVAKSQNCSKLVSCFSQSSNVVLKLQVLSTDERKNRANLIRPGRHITKIDFILRKF